MVNYEQPVYTNINSINIKYIYYSMVISSQHFIKYIRFG